MNGGARGFRELFRVVLGDAWLRQFETFIAGMDGIRFFLQIELRKSLRPSFQPAMVFILPVRWSFWEPPGLGFDAVFRSKALLKVAQN